MANALRDANRITTLIGVSSTDPNDTAVAAVDPITNRLLVTATITGGGAGGTSATDDSAFTAGTGSGTPMMGFVTGDSVDSGDVGVIGMLANRQLKVTLFDSGGSELSVGGGTQYTEDAAAAANPVGNALNLIRDDARGGSLTTTDGDNVAARGTNAGELYVKHVDSIPVTQSGTWNINNIAGTITLPTGAATAARQDTGNTSLATIAGAVSGTEMQVDVLTMPTVTVQATNLDIRDLTSGSDSVAAVQSGAWSVTSGHGKTIKTVTGTISVDTDIVAAVPTKRIKVISYALFTASTTSNTITFQSNASSALWTVPLQAPAANSVFGANLALPAPSFLFATVAGEKLTLDVSAAVNVTYSVTYYDDDAT